MSFYADNNRILVTDNGQTVFDTNDDMPHILGQATFTQTVVFPSPSTYTVFTGYSADPYTHTDYVCTYTFQNVCSTSYQCTYDYVNVCTPSFSCSMGYDGFMSCGTVDSCGYQMVSNCGNVETCSYQNVQSCGFVTTTDIIQTPHYGGAYNALDWANAYTLGDLPSSLSCNFLLSKVTAVKNYANVSSIMTKITSLGTDTFAFQGSALVEIAGQSGVVDSCMSRIISLYPDNSSKKLVLEARHSNKVIGPQATGVDTAAEDFSSSYTFTITVYYGRFR